MNRKKPRYWKNARIPARLFYEILENDKIKKLVISGKPSVKQLKKGWSNIFDEFFELKNDAKMRLVLKTKKEVIHIYRKIAIIEAVVLSLVKFSFPKDKIETLIDQLGKGGIKIDKDKNLDKELLRVLQQDLEGLKTLLLLEENNLKELTKGVKIGFEEMFDAIEVARAVPMKEDISLRQFIANEKGLKRRNG